MTEERDWLAERFEEHRSHLRAVAYRMRGATCGACWRFSTRMRLAELELAVLDG